MKFALVFVLGSFSFGGPPEREPPRDPWFGRDKLYHFVGSALIQGTGHALGRSAGLEYRDAAWTAAGLTLTVGVSKELWDRSRGRFFSWKDLAADALGGGTAAVLIEGSR